METQKIVNLLNSSDNENSKFATKKWYVIDSESKSDYAHNDRIKFLTKSIESSICDYSDAYVLVTGNIAITDGDANTKVALKIVDHLENAEQINETFIDDNAYHHNAISLQYLCII